MRVTVQRMAQGSQYHLHDRLLGGRLGPLLIEWRASEVPAEEIVYILRSEHGIKVSAATVLRWHAIALAESQDVPA